MNFFDFLLCVLLLQSEDSQFEGRGLGSGRTMGPLWRKGSYLGHSSGGIEGSRKICLPKTWKQDCSLRIKIHVGLEAKNSPCCHQRGDFVPCPVLSARMSQPEAEEAALVAHAVSHDCVCSGGGVLLPHYRRNNLWCYCWTSKCWLYDWWTWASEASSFLGLQSKWTIYYGRTCIQLPIYNGRFRFHNPGPIECTKYPKTQ